MAKQFTQQKTLAARKAVINKCVEIYKKIAEDFDIDFQPPKILFNKRGTAAGTAYYYENEIRFNMVMLIENMEEFVRQTVVHEICHILDYQLFGETSHHGRNWQDLMIHFGLQPKRCHSYSTDSVRSYGGLYMCDCQEYKLSKIRHNKQKSGKASYHCKKCGEPLELVEEY